MRKFGLCKKNAIVFPYSSEFAPVLRYKNLISQYNIVGMLSPIGWGLKGLDAGYADKGDEIGIKVYSDINDLINICDTVIIADCDGFSDIEELVYEDISIALQAKKDIVCLAELNEDTKTLVEKKCMDMNLNFDYIPLCNKKEVPFYSGTCIEEIDVPVVFIAGLSENANKFYIQLALRENLLKMGYKVSQIGTRGYCELLGFHSFPDFMYNNISESDKVILFNKYIKKIELIEQPDIIIIGLPGAIMPFNNQFTNRFGILAYQVSQAVKPDFSIVSVLYDSFDEKYFSMLFTSLKYKLGFEIDCFNLSNKQLNWLLSKEDNVLNFSVLQNKFIDEKIKAYNQLCLPVYNILNKKDSSLLIEHLLKVLHDYSNAKLINRGGAL